MFTGFVQLSLSSKKHIIAFSESTGLFYGLRIKWEVTIVLSALVISWFLSFGYVPTQTESIGRNFTDLESDRIATVVEIGLSAELYRLKIYGSMENYQYASVDGNFYPFRADYTAGLTFRLTDSIVFIFEHECDHPVSSSPVMQGKDAYMSQETRIMIMIKGEKSWR